MDTLHNALHKSIGELPHQLLSTLLHKKLLAQGVKLTKQERDLLARRIMTGKLDQLSISTSQMSPKGGPVSLKFTDGDSKWMEHKFQAFMDDLPDTVSSLSEKLSRTILRSLKRRWHSEYRQQKQDLEGFRRRLHKRWGRGLDKLRMLISIAREYGGDLNESVRSVSHRNPSKDFDVLIRLHARSCQVADEVVCLLENGFADGAMARWRTLHEIAAVCHFIQRHGAEAAERYEDHQIVESRKAALQYQKHHKRLKQRSMSKKSLGELEAAYAACLTKHGKDFGNSQGWASKHIGKGNPTIADIQEAGGIDHLGPYYRLASHSVHANPKGIFFKLGHVGESTVLLAGPSNAGMADPGHATAISLLQISASLLHFNETLDNQVVLRVMEALESEIGAALLAAHRKLELDVRRYEGAGKRTNRSL
jgi:Family of unknown function (DUF5677)